MRSLFSVLLLLASLVIVLPALYPKKLGNWHSSRITLGLDLRGGSRFVLSTDLQFGVAQALAQKVKSSEKETQKKYGFAWNIASNHPSGAVRVTPSLPAALPGLRQEIKKHLSDVQVSQESDDSLLISMHPNRRQALRQQLLEQTVEVIRTRTDFLGVAEPTILWNDSGQITVEMPGLKNADSARRTIEKSSILSTHFLQDLSGANWINDYWTYLEKNPLPDEEKQWREWITQLREQFRQKTPAGWTLGVEVPGGQPYFVESRSYTTGAQITHAQVSVDQDGKTNVLIDLNPAGQREFTELTSKKFRDHLFGFVLDDQIRSIMQVGQPVRSSQVAIDFGQGLDAEERMAQAKELSLLLKTGSLPVPLEIIRESTVGPSLGLDSIKNGRIAIIGGFLLVMVFIMLWYRQWGWVAIVSLGYNLVLLMAALVWLGATLTLPGLAGIALTVGMAVDSNIIIFERIKEEFRNHDFELAQFRGFRRSLNPIIDANLTTALTALVLILFASGPIRGFAVTLLIGLATSTFSSIVVSRDLFRLVRTPLLLQK